MDVSKEIVVADAPSPLGPYPHAKVLGSEIFFSGIGPRSLANSIPETAEDQCKAVLQNLRRIISGSRESIEGCSKILVKELEWFYLHLDMKSFVARLTATFFYGDVQRSYKEVDALPGGILAEVRARGVVLCQAQEPSLPHLIEDEGLAIAHKNGSIQQHLSRALQRLSHGLEINGSNLDRLQDLRVDLPALQDNWAAYNDWYRKSALTHIRPTRTTYQSTRSGTLRLSGIAAKRK